MEWYIFIIVIGNVGCIGLSNRDLADVPTNISFTETEVILADNKITVIRENAFVLLTELETLQLENNDVEMTESGAFNGLAN